MIGQLIQNEFIKILNRKKIILIMLVTIAIPLLFKLNDSIYLEREEQNSYQKQMEEWINLTEFVKDDVESLAPYQKKLYIEYKAVIDHRVEKMKNLSDRENEQTIMKVQAFDGGYTMIGVFMFLCALCLPAIVFAGEYSSGVIYQTLTSPCKRSKILLAKLITIALILLSLTMYFYLVMQITGMVFYGSKAISYAYIKDGNVLELSFYLYYLIIALFQYVQMFAVMLLATCVAIFSKGKLVTVISVTLFVAISTGATMFLEILGDPCYNFFPTSSFDLSRHFFVVPLMEEIEAFNSIATKAVNTTYSNVFMVVYDIILLALLYLSALDAFVKQDVE